MLTGIRIIAILLGRCELPIDRCIYFYKEFSKAVFGASFAKVAIRTVRTVVSGNDSDLPYNKYNPADLERVVDKCLDELGLRRDEPLIPDNPADPQCEVYVSHDLR